MGWILNLEADTHGLAALDWCVVGPVNRTLSIYHRGNSRQGYAADLFLASQPCQGRARGFEPLRPLQKPSAFVRLRLGAPKPLYAYCKWGSGGGSRELAWTLTTRFESPFLRHVVRGFPKWPSRPSS